MESLAGIQNTTHYYDGTIEEPKAKPQKGLAASKVKKKRKLKKKKD